MAGYEIAYNGDLGEDLKGALIVYLAAGTNPMTEEAWATYVPPEGYTLNTPRGSYFNELHVLGSPYVPTGEITYITTSDGYTWESVAAVQRSIYPYTAVEINGQTISAQQLAYSLSTPPAGMVLVDSNDKNHENVYYGIHGANAAEARLQYFIQDAWGNTYILKSVNAANATPEQIAQAVADADLPPGWTKLTPYYFLEDVVYSPSYSGENDSIAHANEFRDSADSAWMQVTWGANGITLNAVAEGGLPIWAGQLGGRLQGSQNDDVMYGAQGNDLMTGDHGNDRLDGGGGLNHSFYTGLLAEYTVSQNNDGSISVIDSMAGRDGADSLLRIERLHFADLSLALDMGQGEAGGEIFRLYETAFGRTPDAMGYGYWLFQREQGVSLEAIAHAFLNSDEFLGMHGSMLSEEAFIYEIYGNALDRHPDPGGFEFWVSLLNDDASYENSLSRSATAPQGYTSGHAAALVGVSESNENTSSMSSTLIVYASTFVPFDSSF
jgi:Domain of unknown function (DUF4214)/RTX calcium-binding nonapeptide repeat (4 copies)